MNQVKRLRKIHCTAILSLFFLSFNALAADPVEEDYYRIVPLPIPEALVLEVSGLTLLADGRPLVCNRRGEVFVVENAYDDPAEHVLFHKFAEGLQEPLGLLRQGDWIYLAQRGELTRMRDVDGDDRADEFETVCDTWRVSGNYHEYNFGPTLGPEGNFWITTNKPFGGQPFGAVRAIGNPQRPPHVRSPKRTEGEPHHHAHTDAPTHIPP